MNSDSNNIIKLKCATIQKMHNDIIKVIYTHDYFVEIKDVKEVNDAYLKLSEGKPIYSLLDSKEKFTSFSKEAQQYLAKDAPLVRKKLMIASAVIIDSLPNRLVGKFFIKFHKPNFPMKFFKNEENALEWIESLRHKKGA